MSEPLIGEIRHFAGTFAPRGWAFCDGQLLSIENNEALYSILGTTYGGDGRTTFSLPDLRGRTIVHAGSGPGLSSRKLGQKSGSETNTLTEGQMPAHTHAITTDVTATLHGESGAGEATSPVGNMLAVTDDKNYVPPNQFPNQAMASESIQVNANASAANAGGSQSVNNMQPYQAVNTIIALQGIFPSRN